MKKELSIKAILIGFATIQGLVILTAMVIAVAGLLIFRYRVPSTEELRNDLPLIILVEEIICRFTGGFVTGWIAKHDRVKNAFALAVLDLIFVEAITLSYPIFILSLLRGIFTATLSTLCGGYLAKLVFGERVSL